MRILLDHPEPALLPHDDMLGQIHLTKLALETLGVEVEHLRWWDETQTGDLIHYFGRMPTHLTELAHNKGIKIVVTEHVPVCTRAEAMRHRFMRWFARTFPVQFLTAAGCRTYQLADACVAFTSWDAGLMTSLFQAPPERVHLIPPGVEDVFNQSPEINRSGWLVCNGTLTQETLVLAEAAILARTPLWIIGGPHGEANPCLKPLVDLAASYSHFLQYSAALSDSPLMAKIYRSARGFVLCNSFENFSRAPWEAAASGCPLLLSDRPWARSAFSGAASYCPPGISAPKLAPHVRAFYEQAPALPIPPRPSSCLQAAEKLLEIYRRLLAEPAAAKVPVLV